MIGETFSFLLLFANISTLFLAKNFKLKRFKDKELVFYTWLSSYKK